MYLPVFFFFKQKTAYDMRISDWSADVCSSDLRAVDARLGHADAGIVARECADRAAAEILEHRRQIVHHEIRAAAIVDAIAARERSEEHTSELQSLMRISYAVFSLKKQTTHA